MHKAFLLGAIALAVACPVSAQAKGWGISCETVRAFVAQVGLVQARAVALSYGMTASQERHARRCLADGS